MITLSFWHTYIRFPLCITIDVALWAEPQHYRSRQRVCNSPKLLFMLQQLCCYIFSEMSYRTRKRWFPDGIFQSLKLIRMNSRWLLCWYYVWNGVSFDRHFCAQEVTRILRSVLSDVGRPEGPCAHLCPANSSHIFLLFSVELQMFIRLVCESISTDVLLGCAW